MKHDHIQYIYIYTYTNINLIRAILHNFLFNFQRVYEDPRLTTH